MSIRQTLMIGVSAIALTVAAAAAQADESFEVGTTGTPIAQNATAGGNSSSQTGDGNENTADNLNQNIGQAFQDAQGVISEVQNNGANSAINNGNTVSAIIATDSPTGALDFDVVAAQTAVQTGGSTVTEIDVNDENNIAGTVFQNANGVFSKAQNNGAEAAINNGNTVAAVIVEAASASTTFDVSATNTANVIGGAGNSYSADPSTNDNTIQDNAFGETQGVMSVLQNNGPNSALNNGNAVTAVISPSADVTGARIFNANLVQTASVQGPNLSVEAPNTDTNTLTDSIFNDAEGVGSVLQNNGANSAINNGNAVAAIITEEQDVINGTTTLNANPAASVNPDQNAEVTASVGDNWAEQGAIATAGTGSPDMNTVDLGAFQRTKGVFSVGQNNGANAAINNGNSVAAVIAESKLGNDPVRVTNDTAAQRARDIHAATVHANTASNRSFEDGSTDANLITDQAFMQADGVFSMIQNNGPNSAINNGNSVAAIIVGGAGGAPNTPGSNTGTDEFEARAIFRALVQASGNNRNVSRQRPINALSSDDNEISGAAFQQSEGVFSVLQNNGSNSAINNGNVVAAIVADGAILNDAGSFFATTGDGRVQRSQVIAADSGSLNLNEEVSAPDDNEITGTAFKFADGVFSVGQNNGANAAINNGNVVTAYINGNNNNVTTTGNYEFTVVSIQEATVDATVAGAAIESTEVDSPDSNLITGTGGLGTDTAAFNKAQGVFSVLQNNAANSALDNGNTVAAVVSDGNVDVADITFSATGDQTAMVGSAGAVGTISSGETDSPDTNTINNDAFGASQGVFSVLQNNGPNSAINNGNTVAAIMNSCTGCNGTNGFTTNATYTATVQLGVATASQINSNNTNTISENAFLNATGVYSVTQNNGPNSAINNGNVVSAIITN